MFSELLRCVVCWTWSCQPLSRARPFAILQAVASVRGLLWASSEWVAIPFSGCDLVSSVILRTPHAFCLQLFPVHRSSPLLSLRSSCGCALSLSLTHSSGCFVLFFLPLSWLFFLVFQLECFLWPHLQLPQFFPWLCQLYCWTHPSCYGVFPSSISIWFFLRVPTSWLKSLWSCMLPSFPLESLTYLSHLLKMSWESISCWVWLFSRLSLDRVMSFLDFFTAS